MSECEAAAQEAQLQALAEAFIAAHGRRPEQADIAADGAWSALYRAKKEAERAAAVQLPGGCVVYIVRRRRYCSHAAADGLEGLCSEHAAAARAAAPALRLPARVDDANAAAREQPGWALKRNLKRRMKRMSNPHARPSAVAQPPPDWGATFADPSLPLLLDVGCAKGRFVAALARSAAFAASHGAHNFVGVELFAPLVAAANAARDAAGLRNLHYVAGAAAEVLPALALPRLARVCVQFPDPWQDDNASRRVVTPALAAHLAAALPPGGEVFLVSDVLRIAREMRAVLLAQGSFALHALHATAGAPTGWGAPPGEGESDGAEDGAPPPEGGWLRVRPYGEPTERDKVCEVKWRPVYRTLLVRV